MSYYGSHEPGFAAEGARRRKMKYGVEAPRRRFFMSAFMRVELHPKMVRRAPKFGYELCYEYWLNPLHARIFT